MENLKFIFKISGFFNFLKKKNIEFFKEKQH